MLLHRPSLTHRHVRSSCPLRMPPKNEGILRSRYSSDAKARQKKQSRIIRTLKCMEPAAQTHFNAQVRRNDAAYERKAYHVKMHDCNARSSIHRKREARTQPANMTHRLEEKRRKCRDKKHETCDHTSADKRLSKQKNAYYRLTTQNDDGLQISKRDP